MTGTTAPSIIDLIQIHVTFKYVCVYLNIFKEVEFI